MTALATHPPGFGPDRRARWVLASQIAFRLSAAAWEAGCYVSSAALHAPPGLPPRRPDVVVARGEAPADGVVRGGPLLVVALSGEPGLTVGPDAADWHARGAHTVWVVRPNDGMVLTSAGAQFEGPGGALRVEGTGLVLAMPWQAGAGEALTSPMVQAVG